LAKAKLSKVEAEKSKANPIHYQDPMDVDDEEAPACTEGTSEVLKESPAPAGTYIKISTKESQEIRKSHMVRGNRTTPLHKAVQKPPPFLFPPTISESLLSQFFTEMRQSMASLQEEMKRNRDDVLELRSQNASCSASVTQLADTSTLRIGSLLDFTEPESETVEVMSVTDQPLEPSSNPGPSSTDDQNESVIGQINNLLAEDSDEETDATQDEDLSAMLSESKEEKESPELPFNLADDE
jgi:hypothetical protein